MRRRRKAVVVDEAARDGGEILAEIDGVGGKSDVPFGNRRKAYGQFV